jgi:predicted DNA-binding transcriptional regulator AlpA
MSNAVMDKRHNQQLLLNTRDTAKALCISERTLWGLTKRDIIPHLRIGHRVLYDPCDLQTWIDSQKKGGK